VVSWCRGVVVRCHCSPLATRRDTTRHGVWWVLAMLAMLALMGAWVSVCMYGHCADVGAGVVGSKAQCSAVNPGAGAGSGSPRLHRRTKRRLIDITTLSLLSACSNTSGQHTSIAYRKHLVYSSTAAIAIVLLSSSPRSSFKRKLVVTSILNKQQPLLATSRPHSALTLGEAIVHESIKSPTRKPKKNKNQTRRNATLTWTNPLRLNGHQPAQCPTFQSRRSSCPAWPCSSCRWCCQGQGSSNQDGTWSEQPRSRQSWHLRGR
jgi:hypothetical protein